MFLAQAEGDDHSIPPTVARIGHVDRMAAILRHMNGIVHSFIWTWVIATGFIPSIRRDRALKSDVFEIFLIFSSALPLATVFAPMFALSSLVAFGGLVTLALF